jgi:hypothetical protein
MPLAPLLARPGGNPWENAGGRFGESAGSRPLPSLRGGRNRQSGAAFGPPSSEDRAAALGLHPSAKPVGSTATDSARLVGSLHDSNAFTRFTRSNRQRTSATARVPPRKPPRWSATVGSIRHLFEAERRLAGKRDPVGKRWTVATRRSRCQAPRAGRGSSIRSGRFAAPSRNWHPDPGSRAWPGFEPEVGEVACFCASMQLLSIAFSW